MYDYAFNPKYNLPAETAQQLQQMWLAQENQMNQMLKIQKLQTLLTGALVANELDAKEYYAGNASASHIAYASRISSTMPTKSIP